MALPRLVRSKYCVQISTSWQTEFECCLVLMVQASLVYVYCSDIFLLDEGRVPAIWHIAITVHVLIALIHSLAVAWVGAADVTCVNSWMRSNGRDVLLPIQSGARRVFHDISLLKFVCGRGFDPVSSLIAYSLSSEDDCARVEPTKRWYPYQFPS